MKADRFSEGMSACAIAALSTLCLVACSSSASPEKEGDAGDQAAIGERLIELTLQACACPHRQCAEGLGKELAALLPAGSASAEARVAQYCLHRAWRWPEPGQEPIAEAPELLVTEFNRSRRAIAIRGLPAIVEPGPFVVVFETTYDASGQIARLDILRLDASPRYTRASPGSITPSKPWDDAAIVDRRTVLSGADVPSVSASPTRWSDAGEHVAAVLSELSNDLRSAGARPAAPGGYGYGVAYTADLVVELQGTGLSVSRKGRVIAARDVGPAHVRRVRPDGASGCEGSRDLLGVWDDGRTGLLIVELGYRPVRACPGSPSIWVVIEVPP